MNRLAIIGCGGHGRVVAEIAELKGWSEIIFYDDSWPSTDKSGNWKVKGDISSFFSSVNEYDGFFVAIGDNKLRSEKFAQIVVLGIPSVVLIHPSAVISKYAVLEAGSVVMANAVINPFATIGPAGIVNTGATIDHDCKLGHAVHVSPGANLAGQVMIGDQSWVGIGATVKQKVKIGNNVTIGAGSTVINDVDDKFTVVGTPAQSI